MFHCFCTKYKCKHTKCHGRQRKYKKIKDKHNRLFETEKSAILEIFSFKEILIYFKAARKESSRMKVESINSLKILDSCSVTISLVTRLWIYHCHTFFIKNEAENMFIKLQLKQYVYHLFCFKLHSPCVQDCGNKHKVGLEKNS